jgi:hypothetical protein
MVIASPRKENVKITIEKNRMKIKETTARLIFHRGEGEHAETILPDGGEYE